MAISSGNLLASAPAARGAETATTLFQSGAATITRIVSNDHASPPGFWYDQDEAEWVAVIDGHATLEFDNGVVHEMKAGDWIEITAHVRHRIAATAEHTIWLAVHVVTGAALA